MEVGDPGMLGNPLVHIISYVIVITFTRSVHK